MIEIKNLYKRYHHRKLQTDWVLRDINLTIPSKVSVGLLGRNGAGKSTLLRLIGGMDSPERGEIKRHCRVSWPIGLSGGFQGSMTGRQNVKFVARVHGGDKNLADITQKVQGFAEIGPAFDQPINTYSSGMRARLAFGLSLAFDFDVYLSDEATAVGDRQFRAKATQAFKERVNQSSLIMVSHSEGILKDLCQAGIVIEHGQAQWFDSIDQAISYYHAITGGDKKTTGGKNKAKPKNSANALNHLVPESEHQKSVWIDGLKKNLNLSRKQIEQAQEVALPKMEIRHMRERLEQDKRKLDFLEKLNSSSDQ